MNENPQDGIDPLGLCKIWLGYHDVVGGIGHHAYIVTVEDNTTYGSIGFDAEPQFNPPKWTTAYSPSVPGGIAIPLPADFGLLQTFHHPWGPGFRDFTGKPEAGEIVYNKKGPCKCLEQILIQRTDEIGKHGTPYQPVFPGRSWGNSNSFIHDLLSRIGVQYSPPSGTYAPGWWTPLAP